MARDFTYIPDIPADPNARKADSLLMTNRVLASLSGMGAGYNPPALATLGDPVPFIVGTVMLAGPNVAWVGNSDLMRESYRIEDLKNLGSSAVPVGFDPSDPRAWETFINEIYVREVSDIQVILGTGPGVRLKRIVIDKKTVWTGDATGVTDIPRIAKANVDIKGGARFYDGAANQPVDPNIQKSIPQTEVYAAPIVPNYGGFSHIVLRGWDNRFALDGIMFELARFPNPLGLPDAINSNGLDANLMTLLVEALTSEWNNVKYTIADFDHAVLTTVANRLASENNFGSLLLRDGSLDMSELVDTIERQADGKFFQDPYSGKLTFTLLRDEDHSDFSASVLDIDKSMISGLQISKETWQNPIESVTVEYNERRQDYKRNVVTARTSFNGSVSSQSNGNRKLSMPLVNNGGLAAQIATRELSLAVNSALSLSLETDRKGARVLPGQIVTLTYPQHNIPKTAFFVTKRSDLPKVENRAILELRQVTRVDVTAIFPAEEPVYEVEPLPIALPPRDVQIMDAPYPFALLRLRGTGYWDGQAADKPGYDFALNLDVSVPYVLAAGANKYQIGWVATNDKISDPDQTLVEGFHDYQSLGVLLNPLSRYDGFNTGVVDSISVQFPLFDARLAVNNVVNYDAGGDGIDGIWRQINRTAIFIDGEILSFHGGYTFDENTGVVTYKKVNRGLLDTVAADHAAGAKVWVRFGEYGGPSGSAPTEHSMKQAFLSTAPRKDWDFFGIKYIVDMSDEWFDAGYKPARRFVLPNRPADARINGARNAAGVSLTRGSGYNVTWRIRPRWRSQAWLSEDMSRPISSKQISDDATASPAWMIPQTMDGGFFGMNEWDWNRSEWCRFRVKLLDYWGDVYDLGNVASYRPEAKSVTIPSGCAAGPGRLWVTAENYYGNSDEFAIDWLPITVAGTIIERSGYGQRYGARYGD